MKIKIDVTQEHLAKASRSQSDCLIAQAVKAVYPNDYVHVCWYTLAINGKSYYLSNNATQLIVRFLKDLPMNLPQEITLEDQRYTNRYD